MTGDTTWGVGSSPVTISLVNGWKVMVPNFVQYTPDGFMYESVGSPPGIKVTWSSAGGRDLHVDAAIAELTTAPMKQRR